MIVDCQNFNFSTQLSHQRICVANKALGGNVIQRILSYSLYLQGSSKALIAKNINIPSDTTKSLIKRIHSDGITAFCDRRNKVNPVVKPETEQENLYSISAEGDFVNIYVSRQGKPIVVPTKNTLQLKTVLFTLADSGLISNQDVSNILKYSPNHIQHLRKKMQEEDAYALIDKRQGQNQDYRFTEDVKSELILQFILDISKEKKVSGMSLACNLRERVNLDLSPRSIRNHIDKLGLGKIKKQVLDCLNEVKKNSSVS